MLQLLFMNTHLDNRFLCAETVTPAVAGKQCGVLCAEDQVEFTIRWKAAALEGMKSLLLNTSVAAIQLLLKLLFFKKTFDDI